MYVPPVKPALVAVKLTEPPSQKVNGPLAAIVGCGGIGFTVKLNPTVFCLEQSAGFCKFETTTKYTLVLFTDRVLVLIFETIKLVGLTLVLYQVYEYESPTFKPVALAVSSVEPPSHTFVTGAVIVTAVGGRHKGVHNLVSLKQLQSAMVCPSCPRLAVGPQYFILEELDRGLFQDP